jgi:hypothetical protein
MNLCKDCKYCVILEGGIKNSKCIHPSVSPKRSIAISLVSGEKIEEGGVAYCCSIERSSAKSAVYPCGLDGALFEPISSPNPKSPAGENVCPGKDAERI